MTNFKVSMLKIYDNVKMTIENKYNKKKTIIKMKLELEKNKTSFAVCMKQ